MVYDISMKVKKWLEQLLENCGGTWCLCFTRCLDRPYVSSGS